jgi:uncharacterized protein YgiM (DUF1202 family)
MPWWLDSELQIGVEIFLDFGYKLADKPKVLFLIWRMESSCMLRELAFSLAVLPALMSLSTAGDVPEKARIVIDRAPVRSGPGDSFYVTDHLAEGDEVEIYQRDNEWLAIRPPAHSFSWVQAKDVTSTEQPELVRVIRAGARTRVGSRVSDSRNVQYVRLHAGEALRLADGKLDPDSAWIKVDPPAGEFRWIHRRFILGNSATAEKNGATMEHAPSSDVQRASYVTAVDPTNETREPTPASPPTENPPEPIGTGIASHATSSMKTEPMVVEAPTPAPEPIPAEQPAELDTTWVNRGESAVVETDHIGEPADRSRAVGADFNSELQAISLELSSQVVKESAAWDLDPLRQRAERIVDLASQAHERSQARELLKRIDEFADVRRRGAKLAESSNSSVAFPVPDRPELESRSDVETAEQPARTAPQNRIPKSILANKTNPVSKTRVRMDGQGWLIPVTTHRADMPKFALTDDHGGILQFVSPRAGLNLRPYLRQRVGIIGQQGHLASLGKPLLSASKVIVLVEN